MSKNSRGFTLLEILLVVGIIAILAGIVIIAINPSKQLASARNTQRISDLRQVYNAMEQYYIDHNVYPATLPSSLTEICDTGTVSATTTAVDGTPCGTLINLSLLVPTYMVAIPKDPQGPIAFLDKLISIAFAATNGNGYEIMADANNKIALNAPKAESGVTITVGPVVVASEPQAPTDGLVSYWSFDGNANDSVGGHDGTVYEATLATGTKGLPNTAYSFDGLNDYIVASDAGYPTGSASRTFSVWVNPTENNPGNYYAICSYGTAEVSKIVGIGIDNWGYGGKWYVSAYSTAILGNILQLGTWYHLTVVYDGSNFYLYQNGVLVNSGPMVLNTVLGGQFPIGDQVGDLSSHLYMWHGRIDNVRLYNRALTPDEITTIYNVEKP